MDRLKKYLKKALSVCDTCRSVNALISVLNKYLWHYEVAGTIKIEEVQEVYEMVKKQVRESATVNNFFRATEEAIRFKSTSKEGYKGLI